MTFFGFYFFSVRGTKTFFFAIARENSPVQPLMVDKGTHCALSDLIPTISKYVAMEQKDMAAPQDMLMYERSWEGVFVMVDKGAHCTLHI